MKSEWTVESLCQKVQGTMEGLSFQTLKRSRIQTLVLTGATGWFGRHLARSVLRKTNIHLILLTRTQTQPDFLWPTNHLAREAQKQNWVERIECKAVGNLETAQLPDIDFDALIHSAADISLAKTLDDLWDSNVIASQKLWHWANTHHCKIFHAISTLSVRVAGEALADNIATLCKENDSLATSGSLSGGYAASKWCSESWLIKQASKHNENDMQLAIHRLGLLTFSADEGWPKTDPIWALAQEWRQKGKPLWLSPPLIPIHPKTPDFLPTLTTVAFDWCPVRLCSEKVIEVVIKGGLGAFHWASDKPVSAEELFFELDKLYPLKSCETWANDTLAKTAGRALMRFQNPRRWQKQWWMDLFQTDRHRFDTQNSKSIVGTVWSSPTSEEWSFILSNSFENFDSGNKI